jgi:hypothetical protein
MVSLTILTEPDNSWLPVWDFTDNSQTMVTILWDISPILNHDPCWYHHHWSWCACSSECKDNLNLLQGCCIVSIRFDWHYIIRWQYCPNRPKITFLTVTIPPLWGDNTWTIPAPCPKWHWQYSRIPYHNEPQNDNTGWSKSLCLTIHCANWWELAWPLTVNEQ